MSSPHRFVVRRQVYTPPDAAGVRRVLPEKYDRVITFPKAEAAYADCAKRLAEFRRTTNPFQLGGPCLFYQTNLPAFAFHDYLLDHNITPPPTSLTANPNYVFWWVKNNRTFTDRDREVVWGACDKLKPFDVIEEDDRKAVYLAGRRLYDGEEGTDEFTFWGEGAVLEEHAYREIRGARAARQAVELEHRRHFCWPTDKDGSPEIDHEVEFAAVFTVPGKQSPIGNGAVLIQRQCYRGNEGGYVTVSAPSGTRYELGARVALHWMPSEGEAEEVLAGKVAVARRTTNPFAFVWPDRFDPDALLDTFNLQLNNRLIGADLTIDDAIEIVRKLPTIPPAPEVLSAEWYDRVVQWSPEFIDVIWSTFADFRLFEVIEVPLD